MFSPSPHPSSLYLFFIVGFSFKFSVFLYPSPPINEYKVTGCHYMTCLVNPNISKLQPLPSFHLLYMPRCYHPKCKSNSFSINFEVIMTHNTSMNDLYPWLKLRNQTWKLISMSYLLGLETGTSLPICPMDQQGKKISIEFHALGMTGLFNISHEPELIHTQGTIHCCNIKPNSTLNM